MIIRLLTCVKAERLVVGASRYTVSRCRCRDQTAFETVLCVRLLFEANVSSSTLRQPVEPPCAGAPWFGIVCDGIHVLVTLFGPKPTGEMVDDTPYTATASVTAGRLPQQLHRRRLGPRFEAYPSWRGLRGPLEGVRMLELKIPLKPFRLISSF